MHDGITQQTQTHLEHLRTLKCKCFMEMMLFIHECKICIMHIVIKISYSLTHLFSFGWLNWGVLTIDELHDGIMNSA